MDQEEQQGPEEQQGQDRDWANLPGDLLYAEIAARLEFHDAWSFGRVCKAWKNSLYYLGSKLPLLSTDGGKVKIDVTNLWQVTRPTPTQPPIYTFRSNVYTTRHSFTYRKEFPDLMGCRVLGTFNSWWLILGSAENYGPLTVPVFIFNPFTGSRIPLPGLRPPFKTDVHFIRGIWFQMTSSPVSDDFLIFGLMLKNLTVRPCLWTCRWQRGEADWFWESHQVPVPTVPPRSRRMIFNRDGLFISAVVEWNNARVLFDPVGRRAVKQAGNEFLEPYPNMLEPYPTPLFDWASVSLNAPVLALKLWEHAPEPPPDAAGPPPPDAAGPPPPDAAGPRRKKSRMSGRL